MKEIRVFKNGKLVKNIPYTKTDENFFREHEGYMLVEGMSFTIVGQDIEDMSNRVVNVSNGNINTFVATVLHLGKTKIDSRSGQSIKWARMVIKESGISTLQPEAEVWVKIPEDQVARLFPNGFPNDYRVIGPRLSRESKWIHSFADIRPYVVEPTTMVTVQDDG